MTVQVDWGNLEIIACVLIVFGVVSLVAVYRKRKERIFMQHIAQTFGFTYQPKGSTDGTRAQGLSGGQILDVISGIHNGISIGAFAYRILTGGKNKYWSYMTVLETPIRAALPDIVLRPIKLSLDGAANVALSRTSFLGNYEKVSLEGNFDKYFTLFVTKGAHIEALEIFTPDIMQEMIENYQSYGLEFSSDTLYLYPMRLIKDEASFTKALALLESLATHLSPTLSAMATSDSSEKDRALA